MPSGLKPVALLCTSNGVGLGHLTRQMAIGRHLRTTHDVVIFTLSPAATLAVTAGFHTEYLRSHEYGSVGNQAWNGFYATRLEHLIDQYHPSIMVFDGGHPYAGLCAVLRQRKDLLSVWTRRGLWQPGLGHDAFSRSALFSYVVEPGEYATEMDRGLTSGGADATLVAAPMSAVQPGDLRPADQVRTELGLNPDRPAILMQLGAGQINDIGSLSARVVASLQRHPDVQIVVTESVLTRTPAALPDNVIRVRHFPIGEYRAAFDASVMAAGYNSFQEAMALSLPTLFIPNQSTAKDDQDARTRWAEQSGCGLRWDDLGDNKSSDELHTAIDCLIDPAQRTQMRAQMAKLGPATGAEEIAAVLGRWSSERQPTRP
ncbi:MAG: glycosyltransferase [Acidimicrobiales bacterium]|nr:glycosyltransferase [Acidimicrobiales bacterium]